MSEQVPFDIAVDRDEAFRFEYGPGTTAYVAHDPARESGDPVVQLDDGRTVEQAQVSLFESVFGIQTFRLADGGNQLVDDADSVTGYVAPEADTSLVQLRLMPPMPGPLWPRFPAVVVSNSTRPDYTAVLDATMAAIAEHAPRGWAKLSLRCTATVGRMELAATVVFADGNVRAWSPPAMVSQWLHRLRMRCYRPVDGVWSTAQFEFTQGTPGTHAFGDPQAGPSWQVGKTDLTHLRHVTEDLRALPRGPYAIAPWQLEAALGIQQRLRAQGIQRVVSGDRPADNGGRTELVRLFDGTDATGRPAWYRPQVSLMELDAVLHYLENAPLVLSSRGLTEDLLGDGEEPTVPMGFHTDGRWIWPSAVAYYLRKHGVPPVPHLVDHIRENGYELPVEVPRIAMSRAAALAMGRPWDESVVAEASEEAKTPVFDVVSRYWISPKHYSWDHHRDQTWCLVRDGDWYVVYWADGDSTRSRMRFGDVRDAAAYLAGQLAAGHQDFQYQLDEEVHWWQTPFGTLSELDPSLEGFTQVMTTRFPADVEVDRYGTPDGNMVFVADTPFEQRGLPADHANREYHRYRLVGDGWVGVTAVAEGGGRLYLVPKSISDYLASGDIVELTEPTPTVSATHPGLPPITDAMREEGRRNPGGWVWCADPDVDPRYIEGVPNFALLGAYKVDQAGELTGETYINDEYRPGPSKRGFPEPHTEFEVVLNFVAAGWLPHERILGAVLNSPFILDIDSPEKLRIGVDGKGRRFLVVYSSPRYAPRAGAGTMQSDGRGLLPLLAGTTLIVNPGAEMGIELPGDDLIAAGRMPR